MTLRRFAAPALAVLVALGASGCAGMSFNTGCGFASVDPMSDGASRMSRGFQMHQARAQHQAYQHKAMMVSGHSFTSVTAKLTEPTSVNASAAPLVVPLSWTV